MNRHQRLCETEIWHYQALSCMQPKANADYIKILFDPVFKQAHRCELKNVLQKL